MTTAVYRQIGLLGEKFGEIKLEFDKVRLSKTNWNYIAQNCLLNLLCIEKRAVSCIILAHDYFPIYYLFF